MKKSKLIPTILVFSLLLGSCRTSVNTEIDSEEQQNEEITVAPETSDSEVAKTENNSINHSESSETKPDIIIEDLADGNYRFCSDAHPNEDEPDVHRYCFNFTKTGKKVVGGYSYRAPKDTPIICLEGVVENNLVNGVGYQSRGPSSEPYTKDDFADLQNAQSNSTYSYWDDVDGFQGGFNLKVSSPNLHSLMPPSEDKHTSYWAVIRYDMVQLDLTDFKPVKSERVTDYQECSAKSIFQEI